MICSRTACGRDIPDDALFCPYCGKKQAATQRPSGKKGRAPNGSGTVIKRGNTYTIIYRHVVHGRLVSRTKGGFATQRKWLEISPQKRGHYATAYKRLAELHDRDVSGIRFWEMQAIVEELPGAFYPKRDAKTVLQKLFDLAVVNEYIPPSKAQLVGYLELPSKPLTGQDARTPEEMHLIWQDWQAGNDIAGYMLVMAYAGLRTGELTAIDAKAVDLSARCIIGGIKTDAGRNREIPIAKEVAPVLASLLPKAKVGLCAYGLDKLYAEYAEMVRRTGIRQLRPYCQRHTCYTRLLEVKPEIPRAVINSIIGHSNGKLGDTYGHISLQTKLAAVDAMQMV